MPTKSDIFGALVIGFLIAVFFLVISYTTVTVITPEVSKPPLYYASSLFIFPFFAVLGILLMSDLSKRIGIFAFLFQFYKFALVGVLNTILDLTVLNGLIVVSGIAAGWEFSAFKGLSFAVAVTNSYFWNKFWTFANRGSPGEKRVVGVREFSKFFIVSIVGLFVNVSVASFFVNVLGPVGEIPPQLWANIAALAAIVFSTLWNFIGYKLFVFGKSNFLQKS